MTRAEKLWCLGLSIVLMFLTTLPFLLAYERQDDSLEFTGFVLAVEDGNSFVAKMRRGAEGDWLFRSPYSAQPQAGVPAFLGYLLLGKLAAGPASHEQLVALLHIARILAIPLVVSATYRFAGRFLPDDKWRKWTTLIAVAGGGLGWLLLLLGQTSWLGSQPLELYSPETFGFLGTVTFPHLLLARAFLLLGLDSYLDVGRRPRAAWVAAGWLTALVFVQPLAMAPAVAVIVGHQLFRLVRRVTARQPLPLWRDLGEVVIALTGPLLLIAMYAFLLQRDPYMRTWAAQNVLPSPHPAHYLLAYGFLLPFALVGAWRLWRGKREHDLLLVGWMVLVPLLAYLPVTFQRRMPEGAWVALGVLAALGLRELWPRRNTGWRLAMGLLALSLVSSVLLLAGATETALSGRTPAFQPREKVKGFQWLAENAASSSIVLSSYETGNVLPAWAPVFVVIGHGPETAGRAAIEPRVHSFFAESASGEDNLVLLHEFGVRYVFVGDAERALGFQDLEAPPLLTPVYGGDGIVIYEVLASQSGHQGDCLGERCPIEALGKKILGGAAEWQ